MSLKCESWMKVGTSHSPCGAVVASALRTDLKEDKETAAPRHPPCLALTRFMKTSRAFHTWRGAHWRPVDEVVEGGCSWLRIPSLLPLALLCFEWMNGARNGDKCIWGGVLCFVLERRFLIGLSCIEVLEKKCCLELVCEFESDAVKSDAVLSWIASFFVVLNLVVKFNKWFWG